MHMKMMTERELGQAMKIWADIENAAMIKDTLYNRETYGSYEVSGQAHDVLQTMKAFGCDVTIKEVSEARGTRSDTTARAMRQLARMGLIEQCGKRGHEKLWRDISWQPE